MNFIVSSTILLKQLSPMQGIIGSNSSLPILENFLFILEKSKLKVVSSDLETTMSCIIEVQGNENGQVAIPAKKLIEALKSMPVDTPILFTVNNENYNIELSTGEGKYQLAGLDGSPYPKIPTIESDGSLAINSKILTEAISKTIFATGTDELRIVMTGVCCELSPDKITFAATDAHKLVRFIRKDVKSDTSTQLILPKKPLAQLKSVIGSLDTEVKIEYSQKNAFFSIPNFNLICRLIEGKYPNYDSVIPKNNPHKLTIDRTTFISALKRISIFSNQSTYQVRVKIAGNEMVVSGEDSDFQSSGVERLSCQYEGEDMEIGFNGKFLLEVLSNIDSTMVAMELSTPNRAALVLPLATDEPNEDVLMLVMPVMLS